MSKYYTSDIINIQEFRGQKVDLSGFELTKLIIRSKQLNSFLKNIDTSIQSVNMKAVLTCLASYYNEEYNWVYVFQKDIAEETTLNRKTVNLILQTFQDSGIIIINKMKKNSRRNVYCFTKKFFDIILQDSRKILPSKYVTRLPIKNRDMLPRVTYFYQKNAGQDAGKFKVLDFIKKGSINNVNNINKENNNNFLNKNSDRVKTDFQNDFRDVIECLSPYEWDKYKNLEGYEKRDYLETKRKEFRNKELNEQQKQQRELIYQKDESPLDFERDEALAWYRILPKFMLKTYFAVEIMKKWAFSEAEIKSNDTG